MDASWRKLRDWLAAGTPWGERPRVRETHAALVFLVADRAFKLKKPVALGYLDFSTPERRRAALKRELVLNRRTAPDLYLRVVPVGAANGSFLLGDASNPVDWLLEMRRFADSAVLSDVAAGGKLDAQTVDLLAAGVAQFHDRAEAVEHGDWPRSVARIAAENAEDLRAQAAVLDAQAVSSLLAARENSLARAAPALAKESAAMRRCHGDLHLGNVFLDDKGVPTLFDCIEFDEFYAAIPPLYDVAFLLMDFAARSMPEFASRALGQWFVHRVPESWRSLAQALETLPLYLALRAEIRAKTEARRPGGEAAARRYLELASSFLRRQPPVLAAVGGLSGTGKTSVARALAAHLSRPAPALHLRTDELRKRLAGVELSSRLPETAYTREASSRVYETMFDLAATALAAGCTVVLDAVFASPAERDRAAAIAQEHGARFHGLWLEAPAKILERRLNARHGDASDAGPAVLRAQLGYDLGEIGWTRIDASAGIETVTRRARETLPAWRPP